MNKLEAQEMEELYKAFLMDYYNERFNPVNYPAFNGGIALTFLKADIEGMLIKADNVLEKAREFKEYICSKVSQWQPDEIDTLIMIDILGRVEIRRDWAKALRGVRRGSELSHKIKYCFYESDIPKLAQLHKANKFRKKIESLLTDCNYHQESGDFSRGKYDKYLQ